MPEIEPLYRRREEASESCDPSGRLLDDKQDRYDAAQNSKQQQHGEDIDIREEIAHEHQFRRNRNLVIVSQDENDDGDERNDPPQRQLVEKSGELDDENFPKPVAKKRRLSIFIS